jgi:hypothetical protein
MDDGDDGGDGEDGDRVNGDDGDRVSGDHGEKIQRGDTEAKETRRKLLYFLFSLISASPRYKLFSVCSVLSVSVLSVVSVSVSAHVGSPDTFFTGKAGPYDVRVSVRLPGVIPGRAQVAVRLPGATASSGHRVTVQAAQWNVGLKGAPPPETAASVPGDPTVFSSELWFMTAQPYELSVVVDGPAGPGSVKVPVMAIATAARTMTPWLGAILAALGLFLTVGMLTIIGAAMRESVLPPGTDPDVRRKRSGRIGMAVAAVIAFLALWGGNKWWGAEAATYGRFILYRPFATTAAVNGDTLTQTINDQRWTHAFPGSRYNALLPDHGKLMHMFLIGDDMNVFAHVHPVARTPRAIDFDVVLPPLPAGRYRVYSDIVHESGYAQTLINAVDIPSASRPTGQASDPDDSWFAGNGAAEAASPSVAFDDATRLVWERGESPLLVGVERELKFSLRDVNNAALQVEPYMGMAAHVAVANRDASVFAHLHPSGSVSMAALQRLTTPEAHEGHLMMIDSRVAIPYAFPKAGPYRMWVQVKRDSRVRTAAFDVNVQ